MTDTSKSKDHNAEPATLSFFGLPKGVLIQGKASTSWLSIPF
jgi:hypothetical protein